MHQLSTSRLRHLLASLALSVSSLVAGTVIAAEEVNLYTTREPGLIIPLLEAFTQKTNIKVNTVFVKDGLIERVKAEGARSPADLLMTVDIGNLIDLVDAQITQPLESTVLQEAIPARSEERRVGKECRSR